MHMHRSLIPSRLVPDTPSIPEDAAEEKQKHAAGGAPAGRASSKAPSSKASSKGSSTRASSRSPSIAEEAPVAAASPNMPKSTAAADHKPVPKHRTVNRSLTSASPAFAFGSAATPTVPKLSRSTTGLSSAPQQPFAFGRAAAGKLEDGCTELTPAQMGQTPLQNPLQLGLGKAADAAASAGNVVGHLFGFSASDSAKVRPVFGGGTLGVLSSGISFAAGSSSAGLPSGIKSYTRGIAAEAAAAQKAEDDEEDKEDEEGNGEEEEQHGEEEEEEEEEQHKQEHSDAQEEGQGDQEEGKEDGGGGNLAAASGDVHTADDTQTHAAEDKDEDYCNFALPDDLLSGDEEDCAAAAAGDLPDSDMSHSELSEHDAGEESESHAKSECDNDDTSHADGSELDHDDEEESASQHDDDEEESSQDDDVNTSHDTAGQGNLMSRRAAAVSLCWLIPQYTLSGLTAFFSSAERASLQVLAHSNALCINVAAAVAGVEQSASKDVPNAEQAGVEKTETADAGSMDEQVDRDARGEISRCAGTGADHSSTFK